MKWETYGGSHAGPRPYRESLEPNEEIVSQETGMALFLASLMSRSKLSCCGPRARSSSASLHRASSRDCLVVCESCFMTSQFAAEGPREDGGHEGVEFGGGFGLEFPQGMGLHLKIVAVSDNVQLFRDRG